MPDDDALNPYAPPSQEVVSSDVVGGVWRVEGNTLIIREGTVLPRVDLDGRGKGGPVTPFMVKFSAPLDVKGFAAIGACLLAVGVYFLIQKLRGAETSMSMAVAVAFASQFLLRGVKVRTAPAHLFGYISVPAVRTTMRRARWRRWLTAALLVPVFIVFPLTMFSSSVVQRGEISGAAKLGIAMFALSVFLLLCVAVWGSLEKNWSCTRIRDGWMWIKGLGPEALTGLAARATGRPPEAVKRKVFKIRVDLLPMEFWREVHGSGPLGRFKTWRLLSKMKKPSEMYAFHWSEREWLPPRDADPELLAAWQSETAGTSLVDWPLVYAQRFTGLAGYEEGNELAFLSPDGHHVAIPMISREVIDRQLKERRELHFRSFTQDGRIIATGTREWVGPQFEAFDFTFAEGRPMQVAELHLRRTAGLELVRMDADEVRRREQEELQLWYDTRLAAGLYGPIEEVDFFRPE